MSLGGVVGYWPKKEITKYRTERVVKSEPEDKSEQNPGLLCWGTVGTLPAPVPLTTGFEIAKTEHIEEWRETEPVRIENPDDPEQYVMAARTKRMGFEVHEVNPQFVTNNNTSTGGEKQPDELGGDFGGGGDLPVDLTKRGTTLKKSQLKVIFSNNDGTI